MKHIVLIGPPGSGKGTLAAELKKRDYSHISTGDLLRAEIESGSDLGKHIASLIDNGNMVDDTLSLKVMKNAFDKVTKGALFDGYPRNLVQLKLLETDILENKTDNLYIIYFNIDLDKLGYRVINRWTCPSCAEIYNLHSKPPRIHGDLYLCENDGTTLTQRKDDTEESLKTRIAVFKEKTMPAVELYKKYPNFLNLDASKHPDLILQEVLDFLN